MLERSVAQLYETPVDARLGRSPSMNFALLFITILCPTLPLIKGVENKTRWHNIRYLNYWSMILGID